MIDVVCAGSVYLDLTFEGLEALPAPGEERFSDDLHATPGGAGITAVGLSRLGLRAAVVAPLGADFAGALVRERLQAEGVLCAGATDGRTPVTAVLPVDGDRAFATFERPASIDRRTIEQLDPRAIVVGLETLGLAPTGMRAYAGAGYRDAQLHAGRPPEALREVRALIVNRAEALVLTGEREADGAALALAERAPTAVVTCGADGVAAAEDGELVTVPAPSAEARDTTGAGDLFMAAYVWGDLEGLPLAERLRWAAVYAALSVRTATGAASAATRDELERAIAELGPAIVQTAKEPR